MLPDRVSNPGPLTYESGALPIALRGRAGLRKHLVSSVNRQMSYDFGILLQDHGILRSLSIGKSRMTPSPSIGKRRMTKGSFVKTTASYEVCRLGHYLGSTFTGTDRNELYYSIGPIYRNGP